MPDYPHGRDRTASKKPSALQAEFKQNNDDSGCVPFRTRPASAARRRVRGPAIFYLCSVVTFLRPAGCSGYHAAGRPGHAPAWSSPYPLSGVRAPFPLRC
ncbi:hypothetical protein L596_004284 [Steinernema carpocapsae]|uniref:Uncharacterized protein n=1 Tax=Steinernema carpocapsae TaxID=34508 RepID=A0A4U8UVG0_STECR|nr:hypothetical protein L596_004284 [Steinernema carpocapsae]